MPRGFGVPWIRDRQEPGGCGMWGRPRGSALLQQAWSVFLSGLRAPYALDTVLLAALDALAVLVPAEAYFAYVGATGAQKLTMRATRVTTSVPAVGPHYAGLLAGAPMRAHPLELPVSPHPEGCQIDGPASDAFLSLACGRSVVLRAALRPRQRGLDAATRALLLDLAQHLRPSLALALHAEQLARSLEDTTHQEGADRWAMEVMLRIDRLVGVLCRVGAQHFGASSGYLVQWDAATSEEVVWRTGDSDLLLAELGPARQRTLGTAGAFVQSGRELPPPVASRGIAAAVTVCMGDALLVLGAPERTFEQGPWHQVAEVLGQAIGGALHNRADALAVARSYIASMVAVCDLLDAVDPHNIGHSRRVAVLCVHTATALGLDRAAQESVRLAGRLHDLGMVAIDTELPFGQGVLSGTQRELLREHASMGAELLVGLPPEVCPPEVVLAIRHHHERWDGAGYPSGLGREEIPLLARIVAAAECLVARLSARRYRPALELGASLRELQTLAGTQLDPEVVKAVLRVYAEAGVHPAPPEEWT